MCQNCDADGVPKTIHNFGVCDWCFTESGVFNRVVKEPVTTIMKEKHDIDVERVECYGVGHHSGFGDMEEEEWEVKLICKENNNEYEYIVFYKWVTNEWITLV